MQGAGLPPSCRHLEKRTAVAASYLKTDNASFTTYLVVAIGNKNTQIVYEYRYILHSDTLTRVHLPTPPGYMYMYPSGTVLAEFRVPVFPAAFPATFPAAVSATENGRMALSLIAIAVLSHSKIHNFSDTAPADLSTDWTNVDGGPVQRDPLGDLLRRTPPSSSARTAVPPLTAQQIAVVDAAFADHGPSPYNYTVFDGFLSAGNDLGTLELVSADDPSPALAACSAIIECRGITFQLPTDVTKVGRDAQPIKAYLKRGASGSKSTAWISYLKVAPVAPPALIFTGDAFGGGLDVALRRDTYTVQWLNVSGQNYSFVPPLTPQSALPPTPHLGV